MTERLKTFVSRDLRAAAIPWALARVLVVGSLALTRFGVDKLHVASRPAALGQGLFAWDAAFYRRLAEHGYGPTKTPALRFYPLLPLLSRGLGWVFLGHEAVALIVIANGSALLFGALLYQVTRLETGDHATATRAAWFAAIFPAAVALVLGYAESTFMLLSVVVFIGLRTRRPTWAVGAGFLAGATRPLGVLLALPAFVETARHWSTASRRERVTGACAIVAPLAGTAAYLGWVGRIYGDTWYPLRIQNTRGRRGGFADPLTASWNGLADLVHGDRFGSGLHIVWAAVFVGLLVVVARRLPVSYTLYGAAALLLNLSAHNLDSFERYVMSAFPVLIAVALLTEKPEVERPVLAAAAAGLVGYSVLAFLGAYVP